MRLISIDNAPFQEQSFIYQGETLRLTLRWFPVASTWCMDVFNVSKDAWVAQGLPLVVGVPLLWRSAVNYFFWLTDESGLNMDPVVQGDLGSRCLLYLGDKGDLEA